MADRSWRRHLDARLRRLRDAQQRAQDDDIHDPHLKFYTNYDREAKAFDSEYVWSCRENLSEVLVVAGLFSTAGSSFAIDLSWRIGRDTGEETADLLRSILYTINPEVSPGYIPVPPTWDGPSRTARIASNLVYSGWLLSMLTTFLAMLAKQWLDRYIQHPEMSVAARCRDRQRKWDALDRWPFKFFIDVLPVLLQIAFLLFSSGLAMYMAAYEVVSANAVTIFTSLGAGIYIVFVILGAVSYDSPFQTPASATIRMLFGNLLLAFPPLEKRFTKARKKLGRWIRMGKMPQLLPVSIGDLRNRWPGSEDVDLYLESLRSTNADDAHCVSWVLKNITDREAIDAALQLAGTVQWFEGGCNSDPPYGLIVSTFESCFDHTKSLDPKMRDRAYYAVIAILQVHTFALRKSEECALEYPVPRVHRIDTSNIDEDLKSVLAILGSVRQEDFPPSLLLEINPRRATWISELLLRFVSNNRTDFAACSALIDELDALRYSQWKKFPSRVVENFLLVWCVYLESEAGGGVLRDGKKPSSMEEILKRLSKAVLGVIPPSEPHHQSLPYLLNGLAEWEGRPACLARMAYEWCTTICEEIEDDGQCARLIYQALRVGFRHLPPDFVRFGIGYVHVGRRRMVDLVFKCDDSETVADALCAWASPEDHDQRFALLEPCVEYLVKLGDADVEVPSRLRRVVIRAVDLIGLRGFERVGMEAFVGLLNRLEVEVDDVGNAIGGWASLVLGVIGSEVGKGLLSLRYWKLLVRLMGSLSDPLSGESSSVLWDTEIIGSLEADGEWEKLEFWLGALWITPPPEDSDPSLINEIVRATASLFEQEPAAVRKLRGWVERSAGGSFGRVYADEFLRVCKPENGAERSVSYLPLASVGPPSGLQTLNTTPTPSPELSPAVSPAPSPAPSLAPSQEPSRPPSSPRVPSPTPSDELSLVQSRDSLHNQSLAQSQPSSPAPSLDFDDVGDIGDVVDAWVQGF